MVAQHPFQGRVTRFFSAVEKMVAVYDWLGSLDLHPEHFSLQVHQIVDDPAVSAGRLNSDLNKIAVWADKLLVTMHKSCEIS